MASLRLRISPLAPGGMQSHQLFQPSPSLRLTINPTKQKEKPTPLKISASMALSSPSILSSRPFSSRDCGADRNQESSSLFSVNLDEWMRDSVLDIVKNLRKAPLLVSVYSETDGQGNLQSNFKTEQAIEENWPVLKDEWERGVVKSPNGIIYVEELLGEDFEGIEEEEEGATTRAWGILVQGKGVEIGRPAACYLLKTCRVGAGLGMGLFCTHFCLVRVKNFKESALDQLKDCWLLK